jgi:hypothetical protein
MRPIRALEATLVVVGIVDPAPDKIPILIPSGVDPYRFFVRYIEMLELIEAREREYYAGALAAFRIVRFLTLDAGEARRYGVPVEEFIRCREAFRAEMETFFAGDVDFKQRRDEDNAEYERILREGICLMLRAEDEKEVWLRSIRQ